MRFRVGAVILAGALLGTAALLPAVSEGRGGGPGWRGRCGQGQYQCKQQGTNCAPDHRRLRDGSCGNPDCPRQSSPGDCPGPCNNCQGPGNQGGAEGGTRSGAK